MIYDTADETVAQSKVVIADCFLLGEVLPMRRQEIAEKLAQKGFR
jgi:hypothetical protein